MTRIYIPATSAEQWAQFLAEPARQWRKGYSARTLAYSWQDADGFPDEVGAVLGLKFPAAEILLAFPEHQVPLPGGSRPSQNDIWVLARSQGKLISIAVEGKVSESFGPTIQEWQAQSNPGKTARLEFLQRLLELDAVPLSIRYQLLHRTASALIEAQRFNAQHALMLVHSFSQSHEGFQDYAAFAELMGGRASKEILNSAGSLSGTLLHIAWVQGNPASLSK
ncbi:hypothetical protein Dthio_PD1455 [Desulfonatronospira thiodismutans ASO3-1]|uniref:DUF6946 domain-containing protein n=1 Tax=Desulfonatronospira thiodismutans ASO3-1 TaxID=555779 RepID=D6STU8_9BACT|nr:hypothetical protein [Desulfonatronospira thiodismutans]EFI34114.1 hypothetical protein Dthio_PD1455 [Desulfonatronospira thiodismutans ASO3-1]